LAQDAAPHSGNGGRIVLSRKQGYVSPGVVIILWSARGLAGVTREPGLLASGDPLWHVARLYRRRRSSVVERALPETAMGDQHIESLEGIVQFLLLGARNIKPTRQRDCARNWSRRLTLLPGLFSTDRHGTVGPPFLPQTKWGGRLPPHYHFSI